MPASSSKLVGFLFIIFSILCFGLFTYIDAEEPAIVRWFVFFLAVAFLFLAASPSSRRQSMIFYADEEGLYFPIHPRYGFAFKIKGWLFVSWKQVGVIRVGKTMDGSGVLLALQITDEEIDRGFPNSPLERKLLKRPIRKQGFFEIAFVNSFQNNEDVVQKLNEMKITY